MGAFLYKSGPFLARSDYPLIRGGDQVASTTLQKGERKEEEERSLGEIKSLKPAMITLLWVLWSLRYTQMLCDGALASPLALACGTLTVFDRRPCVALLEAP